jgi:hypothetical protein
MGKGENLYFGAVLCTGYRTPTTVTTV